jgi:hypothetical protein
MALTEGEKRGIVLPIMLTLALLAALGYHWRLQTQIETVRTMLQRTDDRMRENRQTLEKVKQFDERQTFLHQYRIGEWIPEFENLLAAKLFLTERVERGLRSVGASGQEYALDSLEGTARTSIGEFHVAALFPSYAALVQFLREVEESPPPLFPQEIEISKDGIKVQASVYLSFSYRLKNGAT